MDSPAIPDYQDLMRDTELLEDMNFNDQRSETVLSSHEALRGIQSRLDRLRAISLLSSIPELARAPPQDQAPLQPLGYTLAPDTRSSILSQGHVSPPVSPQPDFNDRWSEMVLSFHEALREIQSRLDHLRAISLLSSIPELARAPPQDQAPLQPLGYTLAPDTRSSILSQGHVSPPVSPQPDINNRQTESDLSSRDAIVVIQQRPDHLRTNALLRGILHLDQANPQVPAPLRPLSLPPTLNTREESPGRPIPVVSQDKMTIRQRGLRRLPVAGFPDNLKNISTNSTDGTPPKITLGRLPSQKAAVKLRSAGRKRITFL